MMKLREIIIVLLVLSLVSCKNKDVEYYKERFEGNKTDYIDIQTRLRNILSKNDTLFKFTIEYTGKRLVKYQYKNDSTMHDFDNITLSNEDEDIFDRVMYNQNLQFVIGYRDSTKYVFSGMNKDIIVRYNSDYHPDRGTPIAKDTYLFFEGTMHY